MSWRRLRPRVTSLAPQLPVQDVARSIAFDDRCVAGGATILRPLAPTQWGTMDFYVEDPDGNILCFGGKATS